MVDRVASGIPGREGGGRLGEHAAGIREPRQIVRLVTEPRYLVACSNCGRGGREVHFSQPHQTLERISELAAEI